LHLLTSHLLALDWGKFTIEAVDAFLRLRTIYCRDIEVME